MAKPSTPAVWASGKAFSFQPSPAQQAQGFDYIASIRPGTGAPITDDHDWPLNGITTSLKWVMDQLPNGGIQELLTALLPKRVFSSSDFIRIPDVPGGLIIQWTQGQKTTVGDSTQTINLPVNFPNNNVFSIAATLAGTSNNSDMFCQVINASNSSVTVAAQWTGSGAVAGGVYPQVLAIGY